MEQKKRAAGEYQAELTCKKRRKEIDVNALKSLYGKISMFSKKQNAFISWQSGQAFDAIAQQARVAEATVEIYVIDYIAQGQGDEDLHRRLLLELAIGKEKFDVVAQHLTGNMTLREIKDKTAIRYNEIRAVIAVLINGFFM